MEEDGFITNIRRRRIDLGLACGRSIIHAQAIWFIYNHTGCMCPNSKIRGGTNLGAARG